MTENTTNNATANKWVDLTEICTRFDRSPDHIGNIARVKYRYAGADTIEFDIDGETIRKVGKGKVARYKVISNPHRL